jgi:hypothetical protein
MIIATITTYTPGTNVTMDFNSETAGYFPHHPFRILRQATFEEYRDDCAQRTDVSDWEHKDGVYYYGVATD